MRLFVAVLVPETLQQKLNNEAEKCLASGAVLKLVERQNIHLTILFLGEIAPYQVPTVEKAMERVAVEFPPGLLTVQGIGLFPKKGVPAVVWAGVREQAPQLGSMHHSLKTDLSELPIKFETRTFHPHITLARVKGVEGTEGLQAMAANNQEVFGQLTLRHLVLMESRLSREGPVYYPLARIPLNGQA